MNNYKKAIKLFLGIVWRRRNSKTWHLISIRDAWGIASLIHLEK